MKPTVYRELLTNYLNGTCSEEERVLIDRWLESLDSPVPLPASEEEKKQLLAANWDRLATQTIQSEPIIRSLRPNWGRRLSIAATVTLLLGAGWLGYWFTTGETVPEVREAHRAVVAEQVARTTTNSLQIRLTDGSVVTLEPNSTLTYPRQFGGRNREVKLEGAAFFSIKKDPAKPFLVHTHDLVTKVLGTSFRVNAYPQTKAVTVAVRTGKVSVYVPGLAGASATADPETVGVVLTPNQQVTYLRDETRLIKSLVEKPVILVPAAEQANLAFQDAPVSQVIEAIEKLYGVDIIYDEDVMKNCRLTTSLEAEDLKSQLMILCRLLNASYKEIDAQIVLSGQGCQ